MKTFGDMEQQRYYKGGANKDFSPCTPEYFADELHFWGKLRCEELLRCYQELLAGSNDLQIMIK
jgi:hypothetical protein